MLPGRPEAAGGGGRPVAGDARPVFLFLGTSLTAGLGVDPDSAYPALIQRTLDSAGIPLRAVNAGVSGETSDHFAALPCLGTLRLLDLFLVSHLWLLGVQRKLTRYRVHPQLTPT